jgi:hypothetical protein
MPNYIICCHTQQDRGTRKPKTSDAAKQALGRGCGIETVAMAGQRRSRHRRGPGR